MTLVLREESGEMLECSEPDYNAFWSSGFLKLAQSLILPTQQRCSDHSRARKRHPSQPGHATPQWTKNSMGFGVSFQPAGANAWRECK